MIEEFKWLNSYLARTQKTHKTPINVNNDSDYKKTVDLRLTKLMTKFSKMHHEELYAICKQYKNAFDSAIENYYSGDLIKAQSDIDGIIDELKSDVIAVSDLKTSIAFNDINAAVSKSSELDAFPCFFRARVKEDHTELNVNEMKHIQFSKRDKVRSERFSIPGLPCWYLGSSSYCCWIETNRPADNCFNVSSVIIESQQRILNLTVNLYDLKKAIYDLDDTEENRSKILTLFKLWMLCIVTSVRVKDSSRSFKSEYIIPQLIMMSCFKHGLTGVAYYSKQLDNDAFGKYMCVNLALFCPYEGCTKDHSDIYDSNIKISEPMNYSLFKQLNAFGRKAEKNSSHFDTLQMHENQAEASIITIADKKIKYRNLTFYDFDSYLIRSLKT